MHRLITLQAINQGHVCLPARVVSVVQCKPVNNYPIMGSYQYYCSLPHHFVMLLFPLFQEQRGKNIMLGVWIFFKEDLTVFPNLVSAIAELLSVNIL